MRIRTLSSGVALSGKRVLVRGSLNVPLVRGTVPKEACSRLEALIPTLSYLRKHNARIILCGHLGRPSGRRVSSFSLAPVAKALSALMGERIGFLKEVVGRSVEKKVGALKGGEVLLLENVRFHPGEEKNSKAFARMLSGLADCYVNEAFADSHRNHASIATVPRLLPSYAGFRFAEEVTVFTRVFSRPVRPFVALIGGAKVDAKLSCLQRLLRVADHVLVGGDIANAVLFYERGKRVLRAEKTALKRLFASRTIRRLVVPCDVTERQPRMVYTVAAGQVRNRRSIIDIGPLTVHLYRRYLELARTVVWNGPVGVTEVMEGARSSEDLARSIANLKAQTIVGGGETVTFLQNLGLTGRYTHVSTGGGAMLALLAGEILPGLTALTVR